MFFFLRKQNSHVFNTVFRNWIRLVWKSFFLKHQYLTITNFTKSLEGKLITSSLTLFSNWTKKYATRLNLTSWHLSLQKTLTYYFTPVQVIIFSLKNQNYNNLILFILSLLNFYYPPLSKNFQYHHAFIFTLKFWNLYPFLNSFYFKMRNF